MKISITAFSLSLLIMLSGCAANEAANSHAGNGNNTTPVTDNSDASFIKKLAKLNSKNPVTDAQSSIARGEKYFLCNIGRSRTVPGLDETTYQQASQNCETRCLDGVTDAVIGNHHLRYLQAATTYSASWNKVMINVCQ
ncbi:MAG: hypothetical protein R3F02_16760 [Thiolinea sp.]